MSAVEVVAVIGACAPERRAYAEGLASARGSTLVPAPLVESSPNLHDAIGLTTWPERVDAAVVEFPATASATELIGALAADERSRLTGVVCVVDASHVLLDLHIDEYVTTGPAGEGAAFVAQAQLTVSQIEYASVVMIVNWETLETPEIATIMALLSHLSPRARIRLRHDHGAFGGPVLMYTDAQDRPGWVALLNDDFDPYMTDPRVGALRYENVRPFHPARLAELLDQRIEPGEFGHVVRSAGFCRLATRSHTAALWEHVGQMISLQPLAGDATAEGEDELISVGQDLAFIGLDLDKPGLVAALDAAALTDAELSAGPRSWTGYADPFPAWAAATGRAD